MNDSLNACDFAHLLPTIDELEQEAKFQRERLQWAIATAPNSPHLWRHQYQGTPLQILIEYAKKN